MQIDDGNIEINARDGIDANITPEMQPGYTYIVTVGTQSGEFEAS